MTVLSVSNLRKSFGNHLIFKDVTFSVLKSEKCALVGDNGAGKTTLINIVCGLEPMDGGEIAIRKESKLSYMPQEVSVNSTIYDYMLEEHAELIELEKKMETTKDPHKLDHILLEYEKKGGYRYRSNIEAILKALGFDESFWKRGVKKISGGELSRLKLAKVLASNADILLLDEPTNHLDINMILWLENFLKTTDKTVIFISHDIELLKNVSTSTVHLFNKTAKKYNIGFTKFRKIFETELERQISINESNRKKIAEYEEFVRKYRAGIKSKQVNSRRKMIEDLKDGIQHIDIKKDIKIGFEGIKRGTDKVVSVKDADIGYDVPIIKGLNLDIYRGDKLAVIGANGAGKSTFIKTILGEIKPLSGEIHLGENLDIGYYEQSLDELNFDNTVFDEIFYDENISSTNEAYSLLARFNFSFDDAEKKVEILSGGEKSRLLLLKILIKKPNFLILDEPTNHLDTDTLFALKNALKEYKGTLILVSHDRFFLEGLVDKCLFIKEKEYFLENGGIEDILKYIACDQSKERKDTKKDAKVRPVKNRVNKYKLDLAKNEIEKLENELESLSCELKNVKSDWKRLQDIQNRIDEIEYDLLQMYEMFEKIEKGEL